MNYFNDIITENQFFIDIPDCISDGNDYKETLEKSFLLTKGILELNNFESEELDGRFRFAIIVNNKATEFSVEISGDYVDSDGIISGLNKILKESEYEGNNYFCDLNGDIADFAVAFINSNEEQELISQGLIYRQ